MDEDTDSGESSEVGSSDDEVLKRRSVTSSLVIEVKPGANGLFLRVALGESVAITATT